jgi:hypothetical protein
LYKFFRRYEKEAREESKRESMTQIPNISESSACLQLLKLKARQRAGFRFQNDFLCGIPKAPIFDTTTFMLVRKKDEFYIREEQDILSVFQDRHPSRFPCRAWF